MKKRFWISLLTLPALAFAAPSANDFIEAYKERLSFFHEVLSPSATSPDNVIKRYATFRTTMFKQMPDYPGKVLPFPWANRFSSAWRSLSRRAKASGMSTPTS